MTVTREQAREAIASKVLALEATWTTYSLVVDYDNRNLVNYGTQSSPFLSVEILFIDGYQTDLGPAGAQRVLGSIILTARVKSGSGVKQANELLEHFYPSMHKTDAMAPVRTFVAKFTRAHPDRGWVGESVVIPFWYDN